MTLDKILADLDAARAIAGNVGQLAYASAHDAAQAAFEGSLLLPVAEALPIWQALALYLDDANEKVRVLFQDAEQAKGEDR